MSVAVVIVAAGRGRRLGSEIPKQYLPLCGKTSLRRVCETFLSHASVQWIVPVSSPEDDALLRESLSGMDDPRILSQVEGGETRAKSVRKGLERLEALSPQKVLIHDAARPFLDLEVIERVLAALDGCDGACAALPIVDAVWKSEDGSADAQVPRDGLWRAQTPQGFTFPQILAAHRGHDGGGADDVAVAREFGLRVQLVLGSERNYKITTAADLERALLDAEILQDPLEEALQPGSARI